jgi:hypothetical protein
VGLRPRAAERQALADRRTLAEHELAEAAAELRALEGWTPSHDVGFRSTSVWNCKWAGGTLFAKRSYSSRTNGSGLRSRGLSAWSTTDRWRSRGAMSRPQATGDTGLSAHVGSTGFVPALRMPRVALTHAVCHRSATSTRPR